MSELLNNLKNPLAKRAVFSSLPKWKKDKIIEESKANGDDLSWLLQEEQPGSSAINTDSAGDFKYEARMSLSKRKKEDDEDELEEEDDYEEYEIYDNNIDELADVIADAIIGNGDDDYEPGDDEIESVVTKAFEDFELVTPYTEMDFDDESYDTEGEDDELEERYAGTGISYDRLDKTITIQDEKLTVKERASLLMEEKSIAEKVREKRRKGRQMKRLKGKMKASRKRKKMRMDMATIKKRVHKQAIKAVKNKLAKKKGASSYNDLSMAVQVRVDEAVKKKQGLIKRVERQLMRKYREKRRQKAQAKKEK